MLRFYSFFFISMNILQNKTFRPIFDQVFFYQTVHYNAIFLFVDQTVANTDVSLDIEGLAVNKSPIRSTLIF